MSMFHSPKHHSFVCHQAVKFATKVNYLFFSLFVNDQIVISLINHLAIEVGVAVV